MKIKSIILGVAVAAFLFQAAASAEPKTIGVVDLGAVGEGFERYRILIEDLEQKKLELQSVVDAEEKEVLSLIDGLESVRATASKDELDKRREEIQMRDAELRDFVGQTNYQFRAELDTLQLQSRDYVELVVREIAQQKKLDIVLDKAFLLYMNDALDITKEVVAELNRRFPASRKPTTNTTAPLSGTAPTGPTSFPAAAPAEGSGKWPFR